MVKKGVLTLEAITKRYDLDGAGQAYQDLLEGQITGKAIITF